MELHTIGIDLGKTVFHLVGLDLRGEVVVRKKLARSLGRNRQGAAEQLAASTPTG